MASVTSLDKDMRKLRMDRYTPQAANEVRTFIEESLGERLAPGDLLDSLKDGVALCKLINLAIPNTLRFKTKAVMPFVQMENISLFLGACKSAPFNLQSHDTFLTVDLFESKDPAQVLQCLGSFSRAANRINPSKFPNPIGGKSRNGYMSPQGTGAGAVGGGSYGNRGRGVSNASNTSSAYAKPTSSLTPTKTGDSNSGRWSPTKSNANPMSPSVSSWSKKSDEGATSPAWNIAQYGYMGGASQGNLGVSFGGRRQITSVGPAVPNMAEKEKRRKDQESEAERQRMEAEQEERRRLAEQQAEEEHARIEEEQRRAEETHKAQEGERQKAEEEKRKWEEEEQRWRQEEDARQREEQEAEARLKDDRQRARGNSDARLRGQFLSQYKAENEVSRRISNGNGSESSRIKELERELEQARERERQYERERQAKSSQRSHRVVEDHDMSNRVKEEHAKARSRSRSRPRAQSRKDDDEVWREDERDYLRKQWQSHHSDEHVHTPQPSKSRRPLPEPTPSLPPRVVKHNTGSSRPLPDPAKYATAKAPEEKYSPNLNRTDRYLSSNPAPRQAQSNTTYSDEIGGFDSSAERDAEDRRRAASQQKTKASGWASKSLLEREMEMERQRQQEWEESQKELKGKVPKGDGVDGIGGGIGGKWDVNQWTGYTGGDGQNRGTQGIGAGRRQIVGPRPPPGR
ncbi:related to calponin [Rhynchosporium graminicola]|uniref:Related to calponin n=1 Tax=Rhynchosporium graminicola TaxID=2792576 RepID=A0A1E1KW16_9HELO|nr:related to calponin [Rhynchosporium commune]